MNNKVPYTNETTKFQHIGGTTIPPGETRDVDPSLLPGPKAAAAKLDSAPPADPIVELLKKKVADVVESLAKLSNDDLAKAAALEQDGQNRKSLIEAMSAENLRRAQLAAGGATE